MREVLQQHIVRGAHQGAPVLTYLRPPARVCNILYARDVQERLHDLSRGVCAPIREARLQPVLLGVWGRLLHVALDVAQGNPVLGVGKVCTGSRHAHTRAQSAVRWPARVSARAKKVFATR